MHLFSDGHKAPDHDMMRSDLMTIKQAAGYLGLDERTLYRMKARDAGPKWIRLSPRRIAFRKGDLDEFIESRAQGRPR